MKTHVLDTGAVYVLHDSRRSALLSMLSQFPQDAVLLPAAVLIEVGQSRPLFAKRLEGIRRFTEVVESTPEHVAHQAAAALRAVNRAKCTDCAGFIGPSLIDALVMAFADQYTDDDDEAFVYTSDLRDMSRLRELCFPRVVVRGLG